MHFVYEETGAGLGGALAEGLCGLAEHAEHAFLTKLFLHAVLGLVDTIGVDENQATADVAEVASNEGVVGPESDGDVGLDVVK